MKIENSMIQFRGNNSVIWLRCGNYKIKASVFNDSVFYVGKNNRFNGTVQFAIGEGKNVIIGDECLFSFGIYIRTTDPHLIYDAKTNQRVNTGASIFLGDHIWVGQNVLILKGTTIGSGTVIGGNSVISGKKIKSNTVVAGNPSRVVKENIFWDAETTQPWDESIAAQNSFWDPKKEKKIYYSDENTIMIEELDWRLRNSSMENKIQVLEQMDRNVSNHRFAIG